MPSVGSGGGVAAGLGRLGVSPGTAAAGVQNGCESSRPDEVAGTVGWPHSSDCETV
jgi:hypothetical protein